MASTFDDPSQDTEGTEKPTSSLCPPCPSVPSMWKCSRDKLNRKLLYSSSVSTQCACTISSQGDHAKTVKRPSCEATRATASR